MYYGVLPTSSVPEIISANHMSPTFSASQDGIGIGVLLTYSCDNEIVKFYSYQEYCSVLGGAGRVGGQPETSSTLSLDYEAKNGSLLTGHPGQITWRIS